jgi:nitrous oxidase accessory protein NosD
MGRRTRLSLFRTAVASALFTIALCAMAGSASAATRTVCPSGCTSTTIQGAVNAADPGDMVTVAAGSYNEDVSIPKMLTLQGAGTGAGGSRISGPIGGGSATVQVSAPGVVVDGFTITRDGNNATDWNNPGLNSAGVAVQGQGNTVEVRNSHVTGNRTGVDVNDTNGNSVHNNVIDANRTGLIFRNRTDNTSVVENRITGNFTAGILFIDASAGTNAPVQSATGSTFSGNDISGNWYGQIVDRQAGGSIPAPGSNPKNFSGNWFGTIAPVVSTANSAEPGYAAQIPQAFGGTATAPGGQPDIAGPGSANFDYTPLLRNGTDTSANPGFQGDFSQLTVTTAGSQAGSSGRVQEGVDRVSAAGTVHALAGTFVENVVLNKAVHLTGAGDTTVVDPSADGPAISIAASGTQADPLTVSSLKTTGAPGGGVVGSGLSITSTVSDVTVSQVSSTANSGHGFAVNTGGSVTRLRLDSVNFNSNSGDGLRFPTSMDGLNGLAVVNSHFDGNAVTGMEIYGPASTAPFTGVTITSSTFSDNVSKGIYAERLSNAVLDGVTVNNSGTSGGFAAGIDLNLKKQAFSNIAIRNSSVTNSGKGDTVNGVGITIKARDDGTNGPTTLDGVTLTHNTITGNQLGLRLGDPLSSNAGPTGVHINRNNISGNVGGGMTNVSTVDNVDATCNWWGSASGPAGSGPGTGDTVGAKIAFDPWMHSSNLDSSCLPPVAANDAGSTSQDTPLTVAAPGVLSNDTSPEARPLTAAKVSDPAHGTVTLGSDGSYRYVPAAGFSGTDTFTYRAGDGTADSSPATVTITVTQVVAGPGEPLPGDTIAPVFLSVKLSPATFAVNRAGVAETLTSARAKKGTKFTYALSEPARVVFTIDSKQKGRRVGSKCKKPTRTNRKRRACTRYVRVGSFGQDGVAGVNTKSFSGKIGRKSLKPGKYRASLRARDAAGNRSAIKRLSFKVVRR